MQGPECSVEPWNMVYRLAWQPILSQAYTKRIQIFQMEEPCLWYDWRVKRYVFLPEDILDPEIKHCFFKRYCLCLIWNRKWLETRLWFFHSRFSPRCKEFFVKLTQWNLLFSVRDSLIDNLATLTGFTRSWTCGDESKLCQQNVTSHLDKWSNLLLAFMHQWPFKVIFHLK